MAEKYPEDEFDRLAAERTTRGAHHKPRSRRAGLIMLAAILILAPLAGIAVGKALTNAPAINAPSAAGTSVEGAESTDTASSANADGAETSTSEEDASASEPAPAEESTDPAEQTSEPAEDATPTESAEAADPDAEDPNSEDAASEDPEAAPADLNAAVLVLNGRGTAGFAAENRDLLAAGGFTNVAVGDYRGGAQPAVSTVYYQDAASEATANEVARLLGITSIVESAQATAGNAVVVVAR